MHLFLTEAFVFLVEVSIRRRAFTIAVAASKKTHRRAAPEQEVDGKSALPRLKSLQGVKKHNLLKVLGSRRMYIASIQQRSRPSQTEGAASLRAADGPGSRIHKHSHMAAITPMPSIAADWAG